MSYSKVTFIQSKFSDTLFQTVFRFLWHCLTNSCWQHYFQTVRSEPNQIH